MALWVESQKRHFSRDVVKSQLGRVINHPSAQSGTSLMPEKVESERIRRPLTAQL